MVVAVNRRLKVVMVVAPSLSQGLFGALSGGVRVLSVPE
jgi:hypothetical protein